MHIYYIMQKNLGKYFNNFSLFSKAFFGQQNGLASYFNGIRIFSGWKSKYAGKLILSKMKYWNSTIGKYFSHLKCGYQKNMCLKLKLFSIYAECLNCIFFLSYIIFKRFFVVEIIPMNIHLERENDDVKPKIKLRFIYKVR